MAGNEQQRDSEQAEDRAHGVVEEWSVREWLQRPFDMTKPSIFLHRITDW
jgi:hypothetical protein